MEPNKATKKTARPKKAMVATASAPEVATAPEVTPVVVQQVIQPNPPTVEAVPPQGPPVVQQPQHITIPQEIEDKAVSIWDKVRSWKFFWLAVVVLGLGIYTFFLLKVVKPKSGSKGETEIQQRAKAIDWIINKNRQEQHDLDSIEYNSQKKSEDATSERVDFEKKNEINNQKYEQQKQQLHEKINSLPHTDDAYAEMLNILLSDSSKQ